MENLDQQKYDRAKKKVKEVKGFYSHLSVYIVINTVLILLQMDLMNGISDMRPLEWPMFATAFFWGIGLAFHALSVFKDRFKVFKDWEDRKIKEYMDKDERDFKDTTKWD